MIRYDLGNFALNVLSMQSLTEFICVNEAILVCRPYLSSLNTKLAGNIKIKITDEYNIIVAHATKIAQELTSPAIKNTHQRRGSSIRNSIGNIRYEINIVSVGYFQNAKNTSPELKNSPKNINLITIWTLNCHAGDLIFLTEYFSEKFENINKNKLICSIILWPL